MEDVEKHFIPEHEFSELYEFQGEIGKGSFGTVFQAKKRKCPSQKIAIKSIQMSGSNKDDELKVLTEEVGAMLQLNHENIVKFYHFSRQSATKENPISKYPIT